jgi:hypothetical protein
MKKSLLTGMASLISITPLSSFAIDDSTAIARFSSCLTELNYLDNNWDDIAKGQGDNIRRKLGTVYTPPKCEYSLCSLPVFVSKFVKAHPDDLDIVSFEPPIQEALEAINQADFLAYSSIFSDYGNGGGGKNYLEDSHTQIKRAVIAMKEVVESLKY